MNHPVTQSVSLHPQDQLIQLIAPWVAPLGYQIIYLEVQAHRQKTLRITIDHCPASDTQAESHSKDNKTIGIEDCVKVSRALDGILDQIPEVQALLPGSYELEISSPGINRPLRTSADFQQFAGSVARIQVYRPLAGEELENENYHVKNPKQKNFLGTLLGVVQGKVILSISQPKKLSPKQKKKSKANIRTELTTNSEEGNQVTIPLPLISKANLEPQVDFEDCDERE